MKTKILTKTRSKKRIHNRRNRTRGGATMLMSSMMPGASSGPNPFVVAWTVMKFSFSSMLAGIFYTVASIANIPMTNINYLLFRSFNDKNEKKHDFLHLPLYKVIQGNATKELNPDKFLLQDDMYIHNKVSVISCDQDKKGSVTVKGPSLGDSILDTFCMIPDKRKLRHYVYSVFQYIDNLRENDEERKPKVQKLIQKVPYRTLIKCYLIYRTMTCPTYANEKTILNDEDVVHMVNPLYYPSSVNYTQRVRCMWKHMTQKNFRDDQEVDDCKAKCKSCTMNNSVQRMGKKYGSLFSGEVTSSLTSMLNTYYTYLTVNKEKVALPNNETDILKYLKTIKVSSDTKGRIESDEKEVLEMFRRFLCKYDIIPSVELQIQKKVKEQLAKRYTMAEILDFI